jgi:hypothetical protein
MGDVSALPGDFHEPMELRMSRTVDWLDQGRSTSAVCGAEGRHDLESRQVRCEWN